MIEIKSGTTWSAATQRSDFASDGKQHVSATDKENLLQGEDVGSVLNKVADPNWIDPTKKMRVTGNNQMDKDAFLKLLLTQLKHQDPTNPLKSHEMAAQLAQFTSLEKLTNIDEGIEGLTKVQTPAQNFDALNMIGKTVSGDSSKISRIEGDQNHDIRFELSGDATATDVQILDGNGQVIRSLQFNGLTKGKNEVSWNGLKDDGTPARAGEYRVNISAKNSNGSNLHAETTFEGRITGVNFAPGGPVLMIGNQRIQMSDVKEIVDSSLIKEAPAVPVRSLESETNKEPKKSVGKAAPPAQPQSNMESVAMSREMVNQLGKNGVQAGL